MAEIDISDAAADLAGAVARARGGEDIVLSAEGRAVARIVPFGAARELGRDVVLGRAQGKFMIPDDFDDPLPNDLLDLFEGKRKG